MYGGGRRLPSLPLYLLGMQIFGCGLNNIPPVTLATILVQVIIHLRQAGSSVDDVCASAYHILQENQWARWCLASFFHADDWHLYYNMVSFLFKGPSLESKFGGHYLAFLIAMFSVMSILVMLVLAMVANTLFDEPTFLTQCGVGFSAVLFAFKVLTTHLMPPGVSFVMYGLPIPVRSRISCWVELVLIQLLLPNASFIGHLSGILVGLAYVFGPLKWFMDIFYSVEFVVPQATRSHNPGDRNCSEQKHHGEQVSNYCDYQNCWSRADFDEAHRRSWDDYYNRCRQLPSPPTPY